MAGDNNIQRSISSIIFASCFLKHSEPNVCFISALCYWNVNHVNLDMNTLYERLRGTRAVRRPVKAQSANTPSVFSRGFKLRKYNAALTFFKVLAEILKRQRTRKTCVSVCVCRTKWQVVLTNNLLLFRNVGMNLQLLSDGNQNGDVTQKNNKLKDTCNLNLFTTQTNNWLQFERLLFNI